MQVVTALLGAAIALASGALALLLLSDRAPQARTSRPAPVRAPQPLLAGVLCPSRAAAPPGDVVLRTCLPSRAPPDPLQRPGPSRLPGILSPQ